MGVSVLLMHMEIVQIPLRARSGEVRAYALVDFAYAMAVNARRWSLQPNGYVIARFSGPRRMVYLHRFISEPPPGLHVDHINGDKLDNRRCNLRHCTQSQNQYNRKLDRANKSGYKGVCFDNFAGRWMASIKINKRFKFLGHYNNPASAHEAYRAAAVARDAVFANFG